MRNSTSPINKINVFTGDMLHDAIQPAQNIICSLSDQVSTLCEDTNSNNFPGNKIPMDCTTKRTSTEVWIKCSSIGQNIPVIRFLKLSALMSLEYRNIALILIFLTYCQHYHKLASCNISELSILLRVRPLE